ncbi:type II toxin-antitoxin system HicB family antitoxin [Bacteroidales bacterium OttesenSCG-928-A17]|nr:type II toxin-antitoxin system HicB family antitoxin [Bacteroidales bacterium OttesenSCG-928-A17]
MKDVLIYKDFIGSIHFSSEDNVFCGKIEGINDLVTFEGKSVDELINSFHYAVDEHIKDCETTGIPIAKSYKGSFNVRVSPELHKQIAVKAQIKGMSLNQLINEILDRYVAVF